MHKIKIESIDTSGLVHGIGERIDNSDTMNFLGFYKEDETRFAKVEIDDEIVCIFPDRLTFR
jgi:hypothetical protein